MRWLIPVLLLNACGVPTDPISSEHLAALTKQLRGQYEAPSDQHKLEVAFNADVQMYSLDLLEQLEVGESSLDAFAITHPGGGVSISMRETRTVFEIRRGFGGLEITRLYYGDVHNRPDWVTETHTRDATSPEMRDALRSVMLLLTARLSERVLPCPDDGFCGESFSMGTACGILNPRPSLSLLMPSAAFEWEGDRGFDTLTQLEQIPGDLAHRQIWSLLVDAFENEPLEPLSEF